MEIQEVKKLRLEGWTLQKIADFYGVSRQAVHQFCQVRLITPHQKLSKYQLSKLAQNQNELTKEDLTELLKQHKVSDFDLANYFLFVLGFTERDLAVRSKKSLDDIQESLGKVKCMELHIDKICALQELFS